MAGSPKARRARLVRQAAPGMTGGDDPAPRAPRGISGPFGSTDAENECKALRIRMAVMSNEILWVDFFF